MLSSIRRLGIAAVALVLLCFTSSVALAQSAAGIFSPVVNDGHVSAEYRLSVVPTTDRLVHRLHYQRAVNDSVMWRISVQGRDTSGTSLDLDQFGAELTWQITENAAPWQSGFRFDSRFNTKRDTGVLAVNWANQFKLSELMNLRLIGQTALNIGTGTPDGVFLQTRARVDWRASDRTIVGVESYNSFGSTADIPALKDQVHQAGPFVSVGLGTGWTVYTLALTGLTGASPDEELRFRVGRRF